MSQTPKQEPAVMSELASMANILKPEVQSEVLLATGAVGVEDYFDSSVFTDLLAKRLEQQAETAIRPTICMFICPKLDVTNMQNPSELIPTKFSIDSTNGQQADIFVSRIPRIFQMFEALAKTDSSIELTLLIGDSDFAPDIGYNWLAIKSALENGANIGNFDERTFAKRVKMYKDYLISLLNLNRVQNGIELYCPHWN